MTFSTAPTPDTPSAAALVDHFGRIAHRVLQDAMQQATRVYWLRRADQFEAAKPTPDDFHGTATRADLSAAWRRCDTAARACRAKAEVALIEDVPEVADVLSEVAA